MAALNARDLAAFLRLYADDVEVLVYPATPLTSGKAALAELFEPLFASGDVEVQVHHLAAVDSFVIVERTFSYHRISEPGVAIYEVRDGLITRVSFVRDSRRAEQVPRQRPER